MSIEKEKNKELENLELFFKQTARDYKLFELFLYKLLNHTMKNKKTTSVDLGEADNTIRKMVLLYENKDIFHKDGALKVFWGTNQISCEYEVYKLLTTFEMLEEMYGTIDFQEFENSLDDKYVDIDEKIISSMDDGIKKTRLPKL